MTLKWHINILALQNLRPGAEWSLIDPDDLSTLKWLDKNQPQPTIDEINKFILNNPTPKDSNMSIEDKLKLIDISKDELKQFLANEPLTSSK